jgi:uncharacterized SAM-binding protein YcdF (DUF218 family)
VLCSICRAVCLIQILGFLWALFSAGYFLEGPAAKPVAADVVVVLGGATMSDRLKKGAEIYHKGYAKRLLITGFSENSDEVIPLVMDWRIRYMQQLGIPHGAIIKDSTAKSSWMEAKLIASLFSNNHWTTALVVSDPPHMRRLSWTLDRVFSDTGYTYLLIPSEPVWWYPGGWWRNSVSTSFVLLELIKLGYYWFEYE